MIKKVELDLSNYATKTDLKNVTHVDFSSSSKANLASLKTEVDKLDIDKLTPVPNHLAKFSNVVKNNLVKKTEYNKLVTKVENIYTIEFALKTKYDTNKSNLEKKIPDIRAFVKKKTDYSSKITEIKNKISSISGLTTNSLLQLKKKQMLVI